MRQCQECGSSQLSWGFHNTEDRLLVAYTTGFYLGCDECSATVLFANMDEVLRLLDDQKWTPDV